MSVGLVPNRPMGRKTQTENHLILFKITPTHKTTAGRKTGDRRGGVPVPGPSSSSSRDGTSAPWTPGGAVVFATGQHVVGEGGGPPVVSATGPSSAVRTGVDAVAIKPAIVSIVRIDPSLPKPPGKRGAKKREGKASQETAALALRGQPLSVFKFGSQDPPLSSQGVFEFGSQDPPPPPQGELGDGEESVGSDATVLVVSDSPASPGGGAEGHTSPVDVVDLVAESGGRKRTKRGGNTIPRKRKNVRRIGDADDHAYSTEGEGNPSPPRNRGAGEAAEPSSGTSDDREANTGLPAGEEESPPRRGRPPTTGRGLLIQERKEAKRRVDKLKSEIKTLQKIASGDYSPTRGNKRLAKRKKELRDALPDRPLRDIAAEAVEAARKIDALAAKCGNIQGGFVSQFRSNALFLELAVDAVLTRGHAGGQSQEEEENERLRQRNRALEEEVTLLRKEKEGRNQAPPPSPNPHTTGGRGEREKEEERGGGGEALTSALASLELEELPPMTLDEAPACHPSTSRMDAEDYYDFLSEGPPVHRDDPPAPKSAVLPAKKGGKRGGGQKGVGEKKPTGPPPSKQPPSSLDREEVRGMIEEGIRKAMGVLQRQLEELIAGAGRMASLPSGDRARENAPKVPPTRGATAERPVPGAGGGKGKKKKKGKKEGGGGDQLPPRRPPEAPIPPGKKRPSKGEAAKPPTKGTAPRGEKRWEPAPGPSNMEGTTWVQVAGRKEKRKAAYAANPPPPPPPKRKGPSPKAPPLQRKQQGEPKGKKAPRRRLPRTSAVVLTCPAGEYSRTMAEVRAKLPLSEVGITGGLVTRTAATGAIVFEVSDPTHPEKADALAACMREILVGREGVRVDRPVKTAELRVRGVEASVTLEEVVAAVAEKAGCTTG